MSRSILYGLIFTLLAATVVFGYLYYEESQTGIEIEIGEQGVKIDGN